MLLYPTKKIKPFGFLKAGKLCILHRNIVLTPVRVYLSRVPSCSSPLSLSLGNNPQQAASEMPWAPLTRVSSFCHKVWSHWTSSANLCFGFVKLACQDTWNFFFLVYRSFSYRFLFITSRHSLRLPKLVSLPREFIFLSQLLFAQRCLFYRRKPPLCLSQVCSKLQGS